jgi:hypothetical protein
MESEKNKQIRELLEKYGIGAEIYGKVIEEYSLVGHLSRLVDKYARKAGQE